MKAAFWFAAGNSSWWHLIVCLSTIVTFVSSHASSSSSSSCFDSDHSDRMTSLPGFNQPLPSKWYSGYLDYEFQGQQIHTHYLLIQAEDLGDDDDDIKDKPLIYWSNGGPGASSMFGILTELGPLVLSDLSLETEDYKATKIPTPVYNPYGWTRLGSLLMIDQPAPVGFSYCNNNTDSSTSCGEISWTDELASENAYLALQTFYETKFPCLSSKDLYLTGESYGGIYIPTLARQIVNGNTAIVHNNKREEEDAKNGKDTKESSNTVTIPLKGFAVGDGCLGTQTSICGGLSSAGFVDYWHAVFMAGHHQIPWKDFEVVMRACRHSDQPGFLLERNDDDEKCKKAVAEVKKEIGGFYVYSLYDDCTYRNGLLKKTKQMLASSLSMEEEDDPFLQGGLNDYPCGGGLVMLEYMKLKQVQDAFHVVSDFFEVDNADGFDYTPTEPDLSGFYKEINGQLKVLIYNGDTDPAITSFAAHNWTSHMGFEETQHWRPWSVDGCQRMGGYVVRYDGQFDFLTIRGAGHMVPTYKPAATFTFLKSWIGGDDYPIFDVNCTTPSRFVSSDSLPSTGTATTTVGQDGQVKTASTTARLRG